MEALPLLTFYLEVLQLKKNILQMAVLNKSEEANLKLFWALILKRYSEELNSV